MQRSPIAFHEFNSAIFHDWDKGWYLLASGENKRGGFNMMTVSWGAFGTMWNKPFAMIVVRPTRHTYSFVEKSDSFTLSAFGDEHRGALSVCGSTSGRNTDKLLATNLTPIDSSAVLSPSFEEATLTIECKKMYHDDIKGANFLLPEIHKMYTNDYHRMYFGEVMHINGTEKYRIGGKA